MRALRINKSDFRFQNVVSKPEAIRDADGNLTGEYETRYGPIVSAKANISAVTGTVNPSWFGADVRYDRVITTTDDFGLDERSRLWVDDLTAERHDYVVKRVAKTINGCLVAISRVTSSA